VSLKEQLRLAEDQCRLPTAVERIWHMSDSQGQILALTVLYMPYSGLDCLILAFQVVSGTSLPSTSPQRGSTSFFWTALICTASRRIPASSSTNEGPEEGGLIAFRGWVAPAPPRPSPARTFWCLSSDWEQHSPLNALDLYWMSSESDGVWYRLGGLKKTICLPPAPLLCASAAVERIWHI